MTACSDLQRQCLDLLTKLKINQTYLEQDLKKEHVIANSLRAQVTDKKVEYARHKLNSIIKTGDNHCSAAVKNQFQRGSESLKTGGSSEKVDSDCSDHNKTKRFDQGESSALKHYETLQPVRGERAKWDKKELPNLMQLRGEQEVGGLSDSEPRVQSLVKNSSSDRVGLDQTLGSPAAKPLTPAVVQRRRIIDQNVHVDSKLSDAEICSMELTGRNLNFSYSQLLDGDLSGKERADLNQNAVVDDVQNAVVDDGCVKEGGKNKGAADRIQYHMTLEDRGNNRQLNNFIRDTTIKPKTILNSTQVLSSSNTSKNQGPGVSFQSTSGSNTSGTSLLFRSQARERRLLGYDWIAALVNNDAALLNESESYFQELREFRRSNRDECCNEFYMEGPFTLTETEPVAVEKALKESKVQPYTINERLFTVPITEDLLGQPLNLGRDNGRPEEPTQESPRFVRVSIPRSTLQMPYKVRAHRRKSFDASDSCSLGDHCLMGWNAVSPATLPTAKSVALTDALSGVNPKHAVTMAEAEKAAATFHWPILTDPRPQPDPMATWRRQYMDTTLHFPHPEGSASLSLSTSLGSSIACREPSSLRRKTDSLLNSTYSMMYEMQKARDQRELERKRGAGKAAS